MSHACSVVLFFVFVLVLFVSDISDIYIYIWNYVASGISQCDFMCCVQLCTASCFVMAFLCTS